MNNTIMDKINGRPYGLRILYAALGLFIFAFGVYLTIQANVGLAPWDAFSMGVSYHVPLTYGDIVTLTGFVILAIDLLLKEKIGREDIVMNNCITMIKYQGLGNDYLVLDANKNQLQLQGKKIALLCQRGFGLGADGVLYGPVEINGKMGMRIFNSDGSEAAISGNGVCIFAKYLMDNKYKKTRTYGNDIR